MANDKNSWPANALWLMTMLQESILLVVDLQEGFVNGKSDHVVGRLEKFAGDWLAAGNLAVFTKFYNRDDSQWERLLGWSGVKDSPEADLVKPMQLLVDKYSSAHVVNKETYSSLTPEVLSRLKTSSTKKVFICGIATDCCVLKSAIDIFELGLTPIILSDLCASEAGDEFHKSGLAIAQRFIGRRQIVESSSVSPGG